jgi:hypothetical protein
MLPKVTNIYLYEEPDTPEKSLIAAILDRAIRDIVNPADCTYMLKYKNTNKRSAVAWLRQRHNEPFSFLWICQHLDICPRRTRTFVLELLRTGQRFDIGNGACWVSLDKK